jgi:hypothetical protein
MDDIMRDMPAEPAANFGTVFNSLSANELLNVKP